MKYYKIPTKKCGCGRNYAVLVEGNALACLKCNAYKWSIDQKNKVEIIPCYKLTTINEPLIYPYDIYCEHNVGYLIEEDDVVAFCIICGVCCDRGVSISSKLAYFIWMVCKS